MKLIASRIVVLILFSLPFATGTDAQSIVDFRQAVRTAEPSLMTVVVSPAGPTEQPANRIGDDDADNGDRPEAQAGREAQAGGEGADPLRGLRIEWLDLRGRPLAQAPLQPDQAAAAPGTQEITSAAFAVDESIIVAYIGDLVEQVDEVEIRDATDIVAAVASARAGDTIDVVVSRGEESLTIPVRLTEHPKQRLAASLQSGTGLTIENGFDFKNGRRVPTEIDPNLAPFAPGMGNLPMNEFFRQFQQHQGPVWRFEIPEGQGPFDGSPIERSDVEKTLKELQRQMEQLNQKLDKPQ